MPAIRYLGSGVIDDAKFSPDGSTLYVVQDQRVLAFDVVSGAKIATYRFDFYLAAFDISPNGTTLVAAIAQNITGGQVGFATVDIATGTMDTMLFDSTAFSGRPDDIAFLDSGDVLFSVSGNNQLMLLDLDAGTVSVSAEVNTAGANLIESADGTTVYVIDSSYRQTSFIYTSGSGITASIIEDIDDPYAGASLPPRMSGAGAISDDGTLIFEGDSNNLLDGGLNFTRDLEATAWLGADFAENAGLLYVAIGQNTVMAVSIATGEALYVYDIVREADQYHATHEAYGDILQVDADGSHLSVITTDGVALVDLSVIQPVATSGDDVITSGTRQIGLAGNDTLGSDIIGQVMIGGAGDDTYLASNRFQSIYENADEGTDTVRLSHNDFFELPDHVENLVVVHSLGGRVYGNALDNHMTGGDGDDILVGGQGDDVLDGGAGFDQVQFDYDGVSVDLALQGTPQDFGSNGSDTLVNIEGIIGTPYDDTLLGDDKDNLLEGMGGDDLLDGRDGDDIINGGNGDDVITVSLGTDQVDGGDGSDDLDFTVASHKPYYALSGPIFFTLAAGSFTDDRSLVATSFTSIEGFGITYDAVAPVVFDASGWTTTGSDRVYDLSLRFNNIHTAFVDITGSEYRDYVSVRGEEVIVDTLGGDDTIWLFNPTGTNSIDAGDGFDDFFYDAGYLVEETGFRTGNITSFITADEGVSKIFTNGMITEFTGVERLYISVDFSGVESGEFSFDGSDSLTPIIFFVTSGDDVLIGSAFDDQFSYSLGGSWTDADSFTGGDGVDRYIFHYHAQQIDGTTILDLTHQDIIDFSYNTAEFPVETFLGEGEFTGEAGEYRYEKLGGQTLLHFDFTGDGQADATLTIANGEFDLIESVLSPSANGSIGSGPSNHLIRIAGPIFGSEDSDDIAGGWYGDEIYGLDGSDTIIGNVGDDTIDGGGNVDTAVFSGNRSGYIISQTSPGVFEVGGADGHDTLINVEFAQFDDQTIRLLPGTGTTVDFGADPSSFMSGIRDFDGNDLGGDDSWLLIGQADVDGDGDEDYIFVNREIGRFAEVSVAEDGKVYFDDYGWAGETRVVGIYIDPLVESGDVEQGSDHDSQRRFQNDLFIENINRVLGADDYDGDGLQEVYFALTDGTAYLHAYMHADGNIQYANYQSEAQVIDYLESHGFGAETYGGWFA